MMLYSYQERIFFFPDPIEADYKPWKGDEVWIPTSDSLQLNGALISSPDAKGVILYLHGNRGNVRRCLAQTAQFDDLGYDILVADYRSYGKSDGTLEDEKQMYDDVQRMYDYLHDKYSKIIVIGYSLGSGMAAYIAANNDVVGVMLVAPYVSLLDMKKRFMPFVPNFILKYPFRTDLFLTRITAPIALVHGKADELIPYESSLILQALNPKAELYGLPNVSHRRVIFDNTINMAMRSLINQSK